MEIGDSDTLAILLGATGIVLGILGVIIPVLPGLLLCWLGVLAWAILAGGGWPRWAVLAIVTVLALTGTVVKYAWPGRGLKRSGVPNRTLILGGVLALVGFFVIPLVGLIVGFVVGIWLAEWIRLGDAAAAWPSTRQALKAAGLSMLIELATGLTIGAVWLVGLTVA